MRVMSPANDDSVTHARRQYKCDHCGKAFKRSEHCVRHERSHTREKPFSCRYCRKSYARKDLVTRHERTLHADRHRRKSTCASLEADASSESAVSERDYGDELDQPRPNKAARHAAATSVCQISQREAARVAVTTSAAGVAMTATNMDSGVDMEELQPNSQQVITTPISDDAGNTVNSPQISHGPALNKDFEMSIPGQQTNVVLDNYQSQKQPADYNMSFEQPVQFSDHQNAHLSNLPLNGALATATQASPPGISGFDMSPFPNSIFDMMPDFSFIDVPDFLNNQHPPQTNSTIPTESSNSHLHMETTDVAESQPPIPPVTNTNKRALPLLSEDKSSDDVNFDLNQTVYDIILEDLADRLWRQPPFKDIPSAKTCQGFLSSYVECFHVHLPVIHLPTLCLNATPSPLILAMCSIGALYRLHHRQARRLYDIVAETAKLNSFTLQLLTATMDQRPLWLMQTKLLLTYFAFLSGDYELVSLAMSEYGLYTLIYGKIRLSLIEDNIDPAAISWTKWIQRESWKRLLGGIFVANTLIMVIYDTNPGFNATQDLEFEMFQDEAIWNATTISEWQEARSKSREATTRSMKDALVDLVSETEEETRFEPYLMSTFSALVIMHGVVVHMWHLFQFSHILVRNYSADEPDQSSVGSALINSAFQSLARCQDLLRHNLKNNQKDLHHNAQTSLSFNCQAIIRIAYARLFSAAIGFDRFALIAKDPGAIEISISTFVSAKVNRNRHLLSVVEKSFEGFRTPLRIGHMLVRKTAAFSWGVEHAVAGWDCALLVTKWVHSVELDSLNGIEPTVAENKLLASMRDVLEEADYDPDQDKSLAASLASMWSMFFKDVWVWGVTPRMGVILEKLATAYTRVNEANRS